MSAKRPATPVIVPHHHLILAGKDQKHSALIVIALIPILNALLKDKFYIASATALLGKILLHAFHSAPRSQRTATASC